MPNISRQKSAVGASDYWTKTLFTDLGENLLKFYIQMSQTFNGM